MAFLQHPAVFPDTLCVASGWSPVYRKFGIQEGMIYGGGRRFDLSLKTQYHTLMSNHQLSFGFPILNESTLSAGLQLHYTLSALHGVDTQHKGSCSGGVLIKPHPNWKISLYSMHLLSFPRDSTEHLLEPRSGCAFAYSPIPEISIGMVFQKRSLLPWQVMLGFTYEPWKEFSVSLQYDVTDQQWEMDLSVRPGRWWFQVVVRYHLYLGFSQQVVVAYDY